MMGRVLFLRVWRNINSCQKQKKKKVVKVKTQEVEWRVFNGSHKEDNHKDVNFWMYWKVFTNGEKSSGLQVLFKSGLEEFLWKQEAFRGRNQLGVNLIIWHQVLQVELNMINTNFLIIGCKSQSNIKRFGFCVNKSKCKVRSMLISNGLHETA